MKKNITTIICGLFVQLTAFAGGNLVLNESAGHGVSPSKLIYCPNSCKDLFSISFQSSGNTQAMFLLLTADGELLKKEYLQEKPGTNQFEINTADMPRGTFNYQVMTSAEVGEGTLNLE